MRMWHYKLPDSEIDKGEAMRIVKTLPVEEGNFVGFCNEKGESIQIIRFGQDDYLLDVPSLGIPPDSEYLKQANVDTEKMQKVIKKFLNNEEWMSLCEWKLQKPHIMGIHSHREIPKEVLEKSVEDLVKDFLEFIEKEFPEEKYKARRRHMYHSFRLFWIRKGVPSFTDNQEFELKKEKVWMLVETELEKRMMKENKELLSSLVSKVVEWAKKNELSKITRTDVDIFLMEEELLLSYSLKGMLYRMANLEIRKLKLNS